VYDNVYVSSCSFLPARPDKNVIEGRRRTEGFIEERRAALERYLNRLAAHPVAARSEVSARLTRPDQTSQGQCGCTLHQHHTLSLK